MPAHVHRWMRYHDTVTGVTNHWCIDGDTAHHDEPCADEVADPRTGDHATDVTSQSDWPTL
jgi:hypothetical protein